MDETELKVYLLHPDVDIPKKATSGSACFDIKAFLSLHDTVDCYTARKEYRELEVEQNFHGENVVCVAPRATAKIPTGLKMNIPEGYSVRLHPRSGNSLKKHLVLGNQEGVIDSDYVDEVFIIVYNRSDEEMFIEEGQKICQGELVENLDYQIRVTSEPPEREEREGGFGTTGY